MTTFPTTPSIKIVKTFAYRGGTRTWSNRYHLTGTAPTDAEFDVLAEALQDLEEVCFTTGVTFTEGVCYQAGSDVPVRTVSLSGTGSFSPATGRIQCPGDAAAVVRFATTQRTSKNHPIYLFKYYHGVYAQQTSQPNNVGDDQGTLFQALGDALVAGISDGVGTRELCGPFGAVAQSALLLTWVRHRDFPT